MENSYLWAVIAVATTATVITRAVPFVFLKKHKDHPLVMFLSKSLPPMMMVILVVYAIKQPLLDSLAGSLPWKELLSLVTVSLIHLAFKNSLLSIGIGTALYMLLTQLVA